MNKSGYEAVILLFEGRSAGTESWQAALSKAGYEVVVVHTGSAALKLMDKAKPELVIFDATTMRSTGTRNCRRIRRALPETPIIHCRSANLPEDTTAEADLYLVEPFTPRKLLNRVKALIPANNYKEEMVRYGHIIYYRSKRSIDVGGQGEQRLTPKLGQLLDEFMRHTNQIITRRQLMHNVWQTDYIGDTRTLDVHIRWVREMIEENPAQPKILRTVRGYGYIFSIE